MTEKKRAEKAVELLKREYPDAECSLVYDDPFRLLVAVRLSAQCTDKRVNLVTPALFEKYPTVESFAAADANDVGELIRSCGFFNTKSKDIVAMANQIIDNFGGTVPDSVEQLVTLQGVGRKTANLIVGDIYKKPAVVCDTHFIRIMNRLGFVKTKNPEAVERKMRELLPPEESGDFCHRVVDHGRLVCTARKAKCSECVLNEICKKEI